jgi:hypothetical protein
MHAVPQQPTGPNLFKPSLLAWRAKYLAEKAAAEGAQPATESTARPTRILRPGRLPASRR